MSKITRKISFVLVAVFSLIPMSGCASGDCQSCSVPAGCWVTVISPDAGCLQELYPDENGCITFSPKSCSGEIFDCDPDLWSPQLNCPYTPPA